MGWRWDAWGIFRCLECPYWGGILICGFCPLVWWRLVLSSLLLVLAGICDRVFKEGPVFCGPSQSTSGVGSRRSLSPARIRETTGQSFDFVLLERRDAVIEWSDPFRKQTLSELNSSSSSRSSGIYCRLDLHFLWLAVHLNLTPVWRESVPGVRLHVLFSYRTFNASAWVVRRMRIGKNCHVAIFFVCKFWRDDQDAGIGWAGLEIKFRV